MKKIKQCVLYTPPSASSAQAKTGYSLLEQNKKIKKYVFENSLSVKKKFPVFVDKNKRHGVVREMLTFIKNNNIDAIAFANFAFLIPDDTLAVSRWLNENPNREIHSILTNCNISSKSKGADKFSWDVRVNMAKYFIKLISEKK